MMSRRDSSKPSTRPTRVTVDIRPGPALPAQIQAYRRFWERLLSNVRTEQERGPEEQVEGPPHSHADTDTTQQAMLGKEGTVIP